MKVLCSILLAALVLFQQPALQTHSRHPLTVEEIWGKPNPTGVAPQGIQWAPDGGRVTYLSPDSDLMQLLPTNGGDDHADQPHQAKCAGPFGG